MTLTNVLFFQHIDDNNSATYYKDGFLKKYTKTEGEAQKAAALALTDIENEIFYSGADVLIPMHSVEKITNIKLEGSKVFFAFGAYKAKDNRALAAQSFGTEAEARTAYNDIIEDYEQKKVLFDSTIFAIQEEGDMPTKKDLLYSYVRNLRRAVKLEWEPTLYNLLLPELNILEASVPVATTDSPADITADNIKDLAVV